MSGLWNEAICSNPDTKLLEKLVQSWFRVKVLQHGKPVSMALAAEKEGALPHVVTLLEKHEETNELALATLAGSCKRMKKILQSGWSF